MKLQLTYNSLKTEVTGDLRDVHNMGCQVPTCNDFAIVVAALSQVNKSTQMIHQGKYKEAERETDRQTDRQTCIITPKHDWHIMTSIASGQSGFVRRLPKPIVCCVSMENNKAVVKS